MTLKHAARITLTLLPLLGLHGCFPLVATGITTGAVVAADPRSAGTILDDQATALRLSKQIAQQFGETVNVNVAGYDRNLLLTGEAPDESKRQDIERLAAQQPGVAKIFNEIRLAYPSSLSSRAVDTYLTSAVKGRLFAAPDLDAVRIKVVTENKVVYLLGKLTEKEGARATELAASTRGVEKVVKMFEYVPAGPEAVSR